MEGLLHFGCAVAVAPGLFAEAHIVVIAPLRVALCCCEEFGSLCGILLGYGSVAHFAFEEVLELGPVGLFAVEREGVLVLGFEGGL